MRRSLRARLQRLEKQQPAPGVSFWDLLSGAVSAKGLTVDDLDDAGKEIFRRWVAAREQLRDGDARDEVEDRIDAMVEQRVAERDALARKAVPSVIKELPPTEAAPSRDTGDDPADHGAADRAAPLR
jgi:hypothetical protein